jgi:hypothetical protein
VKNILRQCYGDKSAVTDELVSDILTPGLQPGAAAVFLDFVSYSSGPLPEDLLPRVRTLGVSLAMSAAAGAGCAVLKSASLAADGGRARVHPVGREGPLGADRAGPRVRRL